MSEYGKLCSYKDYPRLRQEVLQRLGTERIESDQAVRRRIFEVLAEACGREYMNVRERAAIGRQLFNAIRGLDVLQPLVDNPDITEIMVNGPEYVYAEEQGEIVRIPIQFESRQRLEDVIQQIVGSVNRSVNEANPIVDARLADGSRVNVILPPVALNGPILTIRKFRPQPVTMREMIEWGTLTQEAADFLQTLVRRRYNLFVCGGTGAGKTTLLNVLSNFIPSHERIITIEDAAELSLSSLENVITLETRNSSVEGKGRITIRELIRTSLRARPDRIIVGEVRGAEALDMLSAMNTGHEGSLSTGHANSAADMISRLETMVLMGADLPLQAIRQQIASALDVFIYISRFRGGLRKITEISQVTGIVEGRVNLEPLFTMEKSCLCRTEAALLRQKEALR